MGKQNVQKDSSSPVPSLSRERPQALWRAEHTGVREHGKGPRTPPAIFFNILS